MLTAAVHLLGVDAEFLRWYVAEVEPILEQADSRRLALLETEPTANKVPRLPVRHRDFAVVRLSSFPDEATLATSQRHVEASPAWAAVSKRLKTYLVTDPETPGSSRRRGRRSADRGRRDGRHSPSACPSTTRSWVTRSPARIGGRRGPPDVSYVTRAPTVAPDIATRSVGDLRIRAASREAAHLYVPRGDRRIPPTASAAARTHSVGEALRGQGAHVDLVHRRITE